VEHLVRKLNQEYGEGTVEVEIRDQYYNMREKVEPVMHIVTLVEEAMKEVGVTPKVQPIRGGTDGARLSFRGLPCPNLSAGYENAHGRFEFVPVPSMAKNVEILLHLCDCYAREGGAHHAAD
jgi:tripeptide aminopeptidase